MIFWLKDNKSNRYKVRVIDLKVRGIDLKVRVIDLKVKVNSTKIWVIGFLSVLLDWNPCNPSVAQYWYKDCSILSCVLALSADLAQSLEKTHGRMMQCLEKRTKNDISAFYRYLLEVSQYM